MNRKEYVNKLVEENIDLVGFVLNRWYKNFQSMNPQLADDVYQEGCIGLFNAARIYDEDKGKFSTIAVIHIKGKINAFIKRYVKKHYKNKNCSIDDEVYSNEDSNAIKLIDKIPSYDEEKDHRIEALETRVRYSKIKNIEVIFSMTKLGYTQIEIGKYLGISQVEVSRKLKKLRQEYEVRNELIKKLYEYKAG